MTRCLTGAAPQTELRVETQTLGQAETLGSDFGPVIHPSSECLSPVCFLPSASQDHLSATGHLPAHPTQGHSSLRPLLAMGPRTEPSTVSAFDISTASSWLIIYLLFLWTGKQMSPLFSLASAPQIHLLLLQSPCSVPLVPGTQVTTLQTYLITAEMAWIPAPLVHQSAFEMCSWS